MINRLVNIFPESSSTRQVNHRGFLSEQGYTQLFPSINHQLKKFLSIRQLAINGRFPSIICQLNIRPGKVQGYRMLRTSRNHCILPTCHGRSIQKRKLRKRWLMQKRQDGRLRLQSPGIAGAWSDVRNPVVQAVSTRSGPLPEILKIMPDTCCEWYKNAHTGMKREEDTRCRATTLR